MFGALFLMLLTGTVYRFLLVKRREDINCRLEAVPICDRILPNAFREARVLPGVDPLARQTSPDKVAFLW